MREPISEVMNCDCYEYMATCKDKQFDLAIVDPDYGLGDLLTIGGTWSAKYKNHEGLLGGKPDKKYFDELFRISKNQIIWGGNYFGLPANRDFLIWNKNSEMPTLADCEYAWSSFDCNAKIFRHPSNTKEKRIHITQKPIPLYKWILKIRAKAGDTIFDSHMGSQSLRIACHEGKFNFYGTEINSGHFDAGCKRFENYKLQLKINF
jgi:site-specific DNA-methyltransferase (adenine-specific)